MAADLIGAIGQSGIGDGFARAGASMMRALRPGPEAYMKGANASLDLLKKQMEANEARNKEMARDSFLRKAIASGIPLEQAELMDSVVRGEMGSDFNGATAGLQNMAETGLMQRAADPNLELDVRNTLNAARTGKVLDQTQISGGTAFNPTITPAEQDLALTPDAAADNMRQEMIAGSQVRRNDAVGQAALTRANRAPAAARAARDPVMDHAAKKRIDAAFSKYRPLIARAADPAEKQRLTVELDQEVERAVGSSGVGVTERKTTNARQQALNVADAARAQGETVTDADIEEMTQQVKETGVINWQPGAVTRDGTTPPQVIDPKTRKPVTGARTERPGNRKFDKDAYKSAFLAITQQGRSKAGVVAKLRANGYTAEADQLEQRTP